MAADAETKLRRGITGGLLFVFILGDVLGAGVYALMGELAGEVDTIDPDGRVGSEGAAERV